MQLNNSAIHDIRRSLRGIIRAYGVFDEETWRGFGITYAQSQALFAIAEKRGIIAKEVSGSLRVDKSTASRMLDKLKRKGLIAFSAAADARRKEIRVTIKGKRTLGRLNAYGDQKTSEALSGLKRRDIEGIQAAFSKFQANLEGGSCL